MFQWLSNCVLFRPFFQEIIIRKIIYIHVLKNWFQTVQFQFIVYKILFLFLHLTYGPNLIKYKAACEKQVRL